MASMSIADRSRRSAMGRSAIFAHPSCLPGFKRERDRISQAIGRPPDRATGLRAARLLGGRRRRRPCGANVDRSHPASWRDGECWHRAQFRYRRRLGCDRRARRSRWMLGTFLRDRRGWISAVVSRPTCLVPDRAGKSGRIRLPSGEGLDGRCRTCRCCPRPARL